MRLGRTGERIRARARRGWILGRVLWRTGPSRVVAVALLAIAQGLQPIAVILETGALVRAIPPAVSGGFDSPAGNHALLVLAMLGGTFVAGSVLQAVANIHVRILDDRYALEVHDAIARATLNSPDLGTLEDPAVADELTALEELERADTYVGTASNARHLLQLRVTGISTFVILFTFQWWAPVVLLVGWRLMVAALARIVANGLELGMRVSAGGMRRSRYLRRLAIEPMAAKEVRIFGLASWIVRRYADDWRSSMRLLWRGRLEGEYHIVVAVVVLMAGHLLVLGAIGASAYSGAITVAQMVVFVQAVLANDALSWLGDPQRFLNQQLAIAAQVDALERRLAAPAPRPAATGSGPVEVRLADLRFTYNGRTQPTLDRLSLTIPAGQSLAIVGENGAGKSTLIKLLCGLYEPAHGTVYLDGRSPREVRGRVGAIFQDFVRYELPLRDNIRFGNLATTADGELLDVLRDAGGQDLIDTLPKGLDTVLARGYDGGLDLSGGQWQKVALARALTAVAGGAGLLILDEPTANLDVRAETELFDRFLELTRDTTTVLVSHRLASVRHADRIVVLEGGRLTEDGSHEELMAGGGTYARMFTLQAQRFAAGVADA